MYLLEIKGEILPSATSIPAVSRDAADDYLLDLCKRGKAHVLITGDEDLLVLGKHGRTRIMNAKAFVKECLG